MATIEKGPAENKRIKISRAQQLTTLEVLVASLILGTCIVLSIFLVKYISFNTKIIAAKGEAVLDYDETLRNVGICRDTDGNGRLSDKELKDCDPNAISTEQVVGSLRYNLVTEMAQNKDLESVARNRAGNCYDDSGERINYSELYDGATNEADKQSYLQAAKICSALRVIPDALPATKNTEAMMASLNQVFIIAGLEPDSLSPRDDDTLSPIDGVDTIPVRLRMEGTNSQVLSVLDDIERSIREFDIVSATIEWTSIGLSINASANAYYLLDANVLETTRVVRATTKRR